MFYKFSMQGGMMDKFTIKTEPKMYAIVSINNKVVACPMIQFGKQTFICCGNNKVEIIAYIPATKLKYFNVNNDFLQVYYELVNENTVNQLFGFLTNIYIAESYRRALNDTPEDSNSLFEDFVNFFAYMAEMSHVEKGVPLIYLSDSMRGAIAQILHEHDCIDFAYFITPIISKGMEKFSNKLDGKNDEDIVKVGDEELNLNEIDLDFLGGLFSG